MKKTTGTTTVTEMKEAKKPETTWEYQYTDTKNYNVDMDIYKTEEGEFVMVDSDWAFM